MKMKYKPMLAYPVSAKPIDYSKPVFIQPKLDGVRCLIQYENRPLKNIDDLSGQLTENVVVAYSRTGKEWKNINHILEELKLFFIKHPNVVLDGELYNHDFKDDFESIISMVRKTKPTDEDRSISPCCVSGFSMYISPAFVLNAATYCAAKHPKPLATLPSGSG